jgi:hypothetical protein
MKSKLKSKLECKFVSQGEKLNNPYFLAMVDWCEVEGIDLERYILNQEKLVLNNVQFNDDFDYDIITKKGLEKVLGKNYKQRMKEIKNIEVCKECIFKYQYRLAGFCNNLYRKKKEAPIDASF